MSTLILERPPKTANQTLDAWLERLHRAVLQASPVERTAVPGVNDDRSKGFRVGSIVIDTVLDHAHICLDSTPAAAVWKQMT